MWKPDAVIYHSPCDDGFGAAWAAFRRWGGDVLYWPGRYGEEAPPADDRRLLIADFSFKRPVLDEMSKKARSIVILDHHKTAQEDLGGLPDPAFAGDINNANYDVGLDGALPTWARFDMNKSGARLAWEFCHPGMDVPELIRLIEDRDLWRFEYPETKAFTLWLRSHPYEFGTWSRIADQLEDGASRRAIMLQAHAVEAFYDQKVSEMLRERQEMRINGYTVPVVNCSWAFASDVAHELLKADPSAPFAAVYYDRANGVRTYSLRSEDSRVDVSAVAKRYGGGGHRNAAGFEVPA